LALQNHQKSYNEYKSFCERNGFKPMASNWFGRKIVGRGVTKGVKTDPTSKKTVNFFNINDDVKLSPDYFMDEMDNVVKTSPIPMNRFAANRSF
jgi:hypothetical protein